MSVSPLKTVVPEMTKPPVLARLRGAVTIGDQPYRPAMFCGS